MRDLIYSRREDAAFIVQYFEDFYCEIIRLKDSIQMGTSCPETAKVDSTEETPPETEAAEQKKADASTQIEGAPSAEVINNRLLTLLNEQATDAARFGGEFATKYYHEAQFIMASLADEIFLHMDWKGRDFWEDHSLEKQLYGTHTAGETFFDGLDRYLKIRDPSRKDIGMLYLLTLGLGFKGKFRRKDPKGMLENYRKELYIAIYHKDPRPLTGETHILKAPYLHTLGNGKVTYHKDFRPWTMLLTGGLALFLIASFWVWHTSTSEIRNIADAVLQASILK